MIDQLSEKENEEQQLEALLLEGLESGDFTPMRHADFEAIKERGLKLLENRVKKL